GTAPAARAARPELPARPGQRGLRRLARGSDRPRARAAVRVAIISQVTPAVEGYSQILRALGHEPVGVVCVRTESRYSTLAEHVGAIAGQLDVVIPASRERFAP